MPALVLFSGGQDSTTSLFWALSSSHGAFDRVEALAFRYGQRHAVELEQAHAIAEAAGVPFTVLDLGGLLSGSALLADEAADTNAAHALAPDLPASFVPGRNALFLTAAASHAFTRGIHDLVGGMCQTDYSGYPDCRLGFIESQAETLSLALDAPVQIHTPLMHLTKAETWKLAADLGTVRGLDVLETVREMSHTDYHGDRSERHPWGYGRLDNPASVLRAKGYEEAVANGWIPDAR
ncbi:7-cyano-7-deazaguanine synthase QueC [Rubrivirga marina]|uniref:7-cyano-7-deazaguanine synthase n=1 Tax=Rubrivirga marina TaxID=1196024 RepID=A0A271IVT2_9BACT|nr:7-cyano-7-deazaguanine synthase QueC [Rubrivirga marina]PAP75227.1 7-cyano-7-deazaguanine synthase QueC [Rubrivirga marina]